MTTSAQDEKKQESENSKAQFAIQKIYTKDISFETPNSPEIFQLKWQPTVDLDLANVANKLDGDFFETVLTLTITVAIEHRNAYLVEVKQAGIFHISGFDNESINRMLGTVCPNILFPFAREAVSDLVTRGGFPQLLLAPVNFEALFLQQQAARQHDGKQHQVLN